LAAPGAVSKRSGSLLGPRPLRMHLAAIVFVALLPALSVGAFGAWLAMGSFQRTFEDRLRDTARGVALVIDREIANHVSTLSALAASPSLDAGPESDLRAFYAHARRAAEAVGSSVALIGSDLRIRVDTDRAFGMRLPMTAAAVATQAALETARPSVSNLLTGAISQRPVIIVNVPVLREGRVVAVIATRIEPERLSHLLAVPDLSGEAIATIADGQNVIVARSREAEPFIGRQAPDWYREATTRQKDGFASGRILTGEKVKLAFQLISATPGWTLMVLEPIAAYHASWRPAVVTLVLGGVGALILALVFAMWLGGRVLSPIATLQKQAVAVVAGDGGQALVPFLPDSRHLGVTEFEALRDAISRAGAAVAASERRHRALVETGAAALWRAESDGYMLESRGWELLTGQGVEELRGKGWLRALHPDDIGPTMAKWRQAMAERGPVSVEYRVRTREGQWLWHRARGVPILDDQGQIEEWFGVIANIHDRKSVEAALAASEARMRALVDTAPDAIVVMDVRGVVQSFNQGAERIFDYAATEAVGRNISMLMPAPDAERHDGYIAKYLRTGERHVLGAVTKLYGLRKDGSLVPLEASIGEWRDAAGARFFTGVLRDITERHAAEERQNLLAREVDHRAKNALTVVQSVLRLTPVNDPKSFAAAVEARVAALARAHSLLAQEGWMAADLRTVAERELAAHARRHEQEEATILAGPPCRLASTAVQPVAMVLHELATNAAKHGALAELGGKVRLVWDLDTNARLLRLRWTESGGPPVAPPTRRGFGSRVIEATVRAQLGGTVAWQWERAGLICDVSIPLARINAAPPPVAA
jgi:PAS domain S-box-containing protein